MIDESLVVRFLSDACAELRGIIKPTEHAWTKPVLQRYPTGYRFEEGGSDFGRFFARRSLWPHFTVSKTFSETLQADPRYLSIREHVPDAKDDGNWCHPFSLTLSVLADYLTENGSLTFDEDRSRTIAANFVHSLSSSTTPIVIFCPVSGITDPTISVGLGDLRIEHVPDDEIARQISYLSRPTSDMFTDITACTTQARVLGERKVWDANTPVESLRPVFRSALTALRVLRDGDVEFGGFYTQARARGFIRAGYGGGWQEGFGDATSYSKTYEWPASDEGALSKIFAVVNNPALPKKLRLALERLNYARARKTTEDKVLHALIALECLFGDGSGAIGYKIGMRASAFLFSSATDRLACKKAIDEAYGTRSSLVHGGDWSGATHAPRTVSIATDAVRAFVLRYAESGAIPKPDELDLRLLE